MNSPIQKLQNEENLMSETTQREKWWGVTLSEGERHRFCYQICKSEIALSTIFLRTFTKSKTEKKLRARLNRVPARSFARDPTHLLA
jgi:hypothetical protein